MVQLVEARWVAVQERSVGAVRSDGTSGGWLWPERKAAFLGADALSAESTST
ncbi:MAG: hypothetical protein GY708_29745 [Actinomycetia bacterium]|nr:hypothetical protein [Actinomycetes bacterium]